MRYKTIFILSLFFSTFLACGSKADKPVETPAPQETEVDKIKDFAYGQKNEFVKMQQSELNRINAELKALEANAKKLKKDALAESNKKIKVLKVQAALLNKQVNKIKTATESTWDVVKEDFNKNLNEFKNSVIEMRTWMSEKIAP